MPAAHGQIARDKVEARAPGIEGTPTGTSQPYHFPVIQEEGVPIG